MKEPKGEPPMSSGEAAHRIAAQQSLPNGIRLGPAGAQAGHTEAASNLLTCHWRE